jgi:hypothetical protein
MIRAKGIIEVREGYADTDELLDSVDELPNGEYGYLLFDKKKNRSLPQLKFLFGYLLKTISEQLEGHPSSEALYRYFEELYAPIHSCNIPGEKEVYEYFDLKNEPAAEMDIVIEKIIHHAMNEWNIDVMSRDLLKTAEAQEAYAGAYADTWKNLSRKI